MLYIMDYTGRKIHWREMDTIIDAVPVEIPRGWLRFTDHKAILIVESLFFYRGKSLDLFRFFGISSTAKMLELIDRKSQLSACIVERCLCWRHEEQS